MLYSEMKNVHATWMELEWAAQIKIGFITRIYCLLPRFWVRGQCNLIRS